MLHDLVDGICREEEIHDKTEKECQQVLLGIVNEILTPEERETEQRSKEEQRNDEPFMMDTNSNSVDTPLSTADEIISDIEADIDSPTDGEIVICDILDSIIVQICVVEHDIYIGNRRENVVVKDTVRCLVDRVSEQHSPRHELQLMLEGKKTLLKRDFSNSAMEGERERYVGIAEMCLQGFGFCLRRFYEHYKSQYSMAYFLAHSPVLKVQLVSIS